jgi:hypothetical protein
MHYYEDPQKREQKLTLDIVQTYWRYVADILKLDHDCRILIQMPKSMYAAKGDVDIAVWSHPNSESEALIAVEIKTMHLDKEGKLKSQKLNRHEKQLRNLEKDGWDYVWLFDFIVTEPVEGWWHPQAFDGYTKHKKIVGTEFYGHAVFQVNSVSGRSECEAGSISYQVLCQASELSRKPHRANLMRVFQKLDFENNSVIIFPCNYLSEA